jgi:hypothetical protein
VTILRAAVVALVLGLLFIGWWEYGYLLPKPKISQPAPQVVISDTDRKCYKVLAWDDAYSEDELPYVIFSGINLSIALKIQPCDIYKDAHTIRAPTQPLAYMLRCCGRKIAVVERWAAQFTDTSSWAARAAIMVEEILADPAKFVAKDPGLGCTQRYIRSENQLLAWTDQALMKREMAMPPVYKSRLGGEWFWPKT